MEEDAPPPLPPFKFPLPALPSRSLSLPVPSFPSPSPSTTPVSLLPPQPTTPSPRLPIGSQMLAGMGHHAAPIGQALALSTRTTDHGDSLAPAVRDAGNVVRMAWENGAARAILMVLYVHCRLCIPVHSCHSWVSRSCTGTISNKGLKVALLVIVPVY